MPTFSSWGFFVEIPVHDQPRDAAELENLITMPPTQTRFQHYSIFHPPRYSIWESRPLGDDEPQPQPVDPMMWPQSRKVPIIILISLLSMLSAMASNMIAPGITDVMSEFNEPRPELAVLTVSIFVLGLCFGPFIFSPLSELHGRVICYHTGNWGFIFSTGFCMFSKNLPTLMAFRFLSGVFGSCPLVIGAATITDITLPHQRAKALAIWSFVPWLGLCLGPVIGAYLVERWEWRATAWLSSITACIVGLMLVVFLHESYHAVLTRRGIRSLRLSSEMEAELIPHQSTGQTVAKAFLLPFKIFVFCPLVMVVSVSITIISGILYILFTTITPTYKSAFGFSTGQTGLTYFAIGIGMLIGLTLVGTLSNPIMQRASRGGSSKPEHRLLLLVPSSLLIPGGLILYGLTSKPDHHWMIPIVGTGLSGAGLVMVYNISGTYLLECYPNHVSSVSATLMILRCVGGGLLPLAGLPVFEAIGIDRGCTILAGVACVILLMGICLQVFGEKLRKVGRFASQT